MLPVRRVIDMKFLRAKMCRQTDSCIWEFDHFCPWVGNAVGRRNYRSFVAFLTLVCILNLALLASTTMRLLHYLTAARLSSKRVEKHIFGLKNVIVAFQGCTVASILVVLALLVCFSVCGLWFFHIWLISTSCTTHENMKGIWWRFQNPYDRGCLRNWLRFLTRRVPRSQLAMAVDGAPPPPGDNKIDPCLDLHGLL